MCSASVKYPTDGMKTEFLSPCTGASSMGSSCTNLPCLARSWKFSIWTQTACKDRHLATRTHFSTLSQEKYRPGWPCPGMLFKFILECFTWIMIDWVSQVSCMNLDSGIVVVVPFPAIRKHKIKNCIYRDTLVLYSMTVNWPWPSQWAGLQSNLIQWNKMNSSNRILPQHDHL